MLGSIRYDVFISAYNRSERVQVLWNSVGSGFRVWLLHAEYDLDTDVGTPSDLKVLGDSEAGEMDFWRALLESPQFSELDRDSSIGIDITGLMRPHVVALPLAFALFGFTNVHVLYSDPSSYIAGTGTTFSIGPVASVSPINGFEGVHVSSLRQKDLLVIGGGYDDALMSAVAEAKRAAEHAVLVGLPSLQPHMYQESVLSIYRASESINNYSRRDHLFSPASDPFATAMVVSEFVASRLAQSKVNVYLCPIGPKPQALGFSIFYLNEAVGRSVSIIFPYSSHYSSETSTGLARTWVYDLELATLDLSEFKV